MKDASIVIDFFKKAAKSLVAGVAGAVTSSDEVKLVPAIAPIPVSDVNEQYGRAEPVERPKKEEAGPKYEEIVEERIKEVAFKKSMPYQPEVALFKGGFVKRETIAKVGEKGPEVVTPVKNYAESVELVYKQGAALLISSSLGFLDRLPPSKGKSTIRKEANRLAAIFGIVNSPKPQKTIGLSSKLEWWGGSGSNITARTTDGSEDGRSPKNNEGGNNKSGFPRIPGKFLKNLGVFTIGATLFSAGYFIPKLFPSTAKSKTDNNVEDFKENKLLEKTTNEETGEKLELSEYERIIAERESIEETIAALEKELEDKKKNRSGFTNFLKGTVSGEFGEIKKQIKKLRKELNKKVTNDSGNEVLYYYPNSPKEIEEQNEFENKLLENEKAWMKKHKEMEENPDPFKHDKYWNPIVLNPPTANAWEKAVNAAKKDGINLPRSVTSSYRSPEQQAGLIYAANKGEKGIVNPAPIGESAHGQGWAIDIISPSPANDWMRLNAKQFGFEWQGEKDPVHFDFITNEENTKYLQHGNDSWIPKNIKSKTISHISPGDTTEGELSTKAALAAWREGNPNIDPCDCNSAITTINEEPVNQGLQNATGNEITLSKIIAVPQSQIVPVFVAQNTENEEDDSKTIIDPFSKAVVYEGGIA